MRLLSVLARDGFFMQLYTDLLQHNALETWGTDTAKRLQAIPALPLFGKHKNP